MDSIVSKLEELSEQYINSIKDKPVATIIKTLIAIWLISKIKKMLK